MGDVLPKVVAKDTLEARSVLRVELPEALVHHFLLALGTGVRGVCHLYELYPDGGHPVIYTCMANFDELGSGRLGLVIALLGERGMLGTLLVAYHEVEVQFSHAPVFLAG